MRYLRRLERIFLVSIFLSMVGLFTLNVLAREIGGTFASQFAWIEEAVRLMNLFLVFGALGLALERGRHVGIDTLREWLPERSRTIARKVIDTVGFFFSAYLSYLAYQLVIFVLGTGQRSPTLDLPMGWVYVAPVMGFALLALRYLLSFLSVIDRFSPHEENGEASPVEGAQH
ncbi:TRAP transporter small permease [Labrenzia sp. CE80]|uniref:TRAP transporter small permease n=1 Tax=Labrenzia sp. CE80 TaxID=1788986 RepID=UPI00129B5509|nr:TRAP transporter small permease [Labrenzia sp. CE80]